MDKAKCANEKCPKKENCERYTCRADEYQTYAEFNEKDCEYFIPNKLKNNP